MPYHAAVKSPFAAASSQFCLDLAFFAGIEHRRGAGGS